MYIKIELIYSITSRRICMLKVYKDVLETPSKRSTKCKTKRTLKRAPRKQKQKQETSSCVAECF